MLSIIYRTRNTCLLFFESIAVIRSVIIGVFCFLNLSFEKI